MKQNALYVIIRFSSIIHLITKLHFLLIIKTETATEKR